MERNNLAADALKQAVPHLSWPRPRACRRRGGCALLPVDPDGREQLEPMLEGWTTLGFMAAHSQRARLGLMVGGVHYRNPALWVKAATTLDVLSGGRAWLGIGAAWNQAESEGLGFPFPPLRDRFEMLEETLQIALAMWQGERSR